LPTYIIDYLDHEIIPPVDIDDGSGGIHDTITNKPGGSGGNYNASSKKTPSLLTGSGGNHQESR
jgi:hypothetical protein